MEYSHSDKRPLPRAVRVVVNPGQITLTEKQKAVVAHLPLKPVAFTK
jgi:hypothetical protein